MQIGKILWWDSKDKNGQIKTGDGTKYYFDSSVLVGTKVEKLQAGAYVSFEPNTKVKTCLCATDVKLTPTKSLKAAEKKFIKAMQLELIEGSSAA